MYDEILLSNKFSDNVSSQSESLNDLDKIFDINHYGSHMETSIVFMKYMYQDL